MIAFLSAFALLALAAVTFWALCSSLGAAWARILAFLISED